MATEASEQMEIAAATAGAEEEEVILQDEYQFQFETADESLKEGALPHAEAVATFSRLLKANDRTDEVAVKVKEQCLYRLGRLFTEEKNFDQVLSLLRDNNEFFGVIPKIKTAKIVRSMMDIIAKVPDSLKVQIQFCRDIIEWCRVEKRTFLRQRIESRLAQLLLSNNELHAALALINTLLGELRKLDDKQMLTEAHLTEARIQHALRNVPKAKAALTASRTSAHAIYVAPALQAELDEMSGVLHCEESDYTTAYSYFLEAHDGYDQASDPKALTCLQYMILCKVLNGHAKEVPSLLSSKIGLKHSGLEVEAMDAIAKAATVKSLEMFQAAVDKHSASFKSDHLILHNLDKLYDKMLEDNLLKIIHPYSCVEIAHVAQKIKLPLQQVERKLSQMILDHRFAGILNQGRGELIIYDNPPSDASYSHGVEVIGNMGLVVDALLHRAKNLTTTAV